MNARDARRLAVGVVLGLAALLLWWPPVLRRAAPPVQKQPSAADAVDTGVSPARVDPDPDLLASSPPPPAAAPCTPHTDLACHDGNVFWFDSCGQPTDLVEDCDDRGCDGALCAEPDPIVDDCGRVSAYGQCTGSVAEACVDGRLIRVDCASQRERCAMTSEGAVCLPLADKNACTGNERPVCEGERLRLCVDGRFRSIDCAARKAHCSNAGALAHCEGDVTPPELTVTINAELCDGKDNDEDWRVDEGGACDEVPLVAFVPTGAQLIALEVRMARELAILNQTYAPTKFRWAAVKPAPTEYRAFDVQHLDQAAELLARSESKAFLRRQASPLTAPDDSAGLDFYVPVLFSEQLTVKPPKAGISTLPNARCGGVRVSDAPSPVAGLIVLTEARQPETLAHEMGHYLGLCHTHEQLALFAMQSSADIIECERTGDGICDTPVDPGSPACFRSDGICELECHSGERPDPYNIMSYYIGCRRRLSEEQLAEAARNLQLRREWFRCLDPRDCPCEPAAKGACPPEMSCHPGGASERGAFSCELDGPGAPGTACKAASQCAQRAFCIGGVGAGVTGRCVRPCDNELGCTCADVGLGVRVCAEDLR